MTTWPVPLHEDDNGIKTSSSYGDPGDGSDEWYTIVKALAGAFDDGAIVSIGELADAAVTNPANPGSVIALLKGILTNLGGVGGVSKLEDAVAASGDAGTPILAIRRDAATNDVSGAGDYAMLHVDATGSLHTMDFAAVAHLATLVGNFKAEDAASAGGELLLPIGTVRRDTPVADAGTAGDWAVLHTDDFGRLMTAENAAYASNATVGAYDNDLVIKAAAGRLWGLQGYNSGPAQFIQLHNAAATPADAAVPQVVFEVDATSNFSIDFGPKGRRFATGIVVCNSTTGPTKTIGAADCWFDAQYE